MGRTSATYRERVRGTEERWSAYRRALRRRDRDHFDRLFEHARAHADAGGYLNHRTVEIPILVSVLLEQEKRLARLEEGETRPGDETRLDRPERRVADPEAGGEARDTELGDGAASRGDGARCAGTDAER
jgi:hypothetical protein